MTETYDIAEQKFGIKAYASPSIPGFAAVLKGRFSDFCVREVDDDGIAAKLLSLEDNLSPPIPPTAAVVDSDANVNDNTNTSSAEGKKRSADDVNGNDNTNTDEKIESTNDTTTTANEEPSAKKPKIDSNDDEAAEAATSGDASKVEDKDVEMKDKTIATTTAAATTEMTNEEKTNQRTQKLNSLLKDHDDSDNNATKLILGIISKWEPTVQATMEARNARANKTTYKFPALPKKGSDDKSKYVTLPFIIDNKQLRTDIHLFIKSDLMKDVTMSDTIDKKVRIWHKLFEKQMPNYKKFGTNNDRDRDGNNTRKKKEVWPTSRPDFLRFVLYKENIDTTTAVKDIARIVRINPRGPRHMKHVSGGITYSGMKDKRGVTAQYCTVFRKTPSDLLLMNHHRKKTDDRNNGRNGGGGGGGNTKNNGIGIIRVGSFSFVNKEQRLGMLKGNRFDIVLRNVCIDQKKVEDTDVDVIQQTTQRLRDGAKAMKEIGFINFFGMQRFGKFHDTHLVGIAVLKGDFKTACDIIMRAKPREQERYKALRMKWENRFAGIDVEADSAAADEAEVNCARDMLRGLGRFMNCETSIVHSLSRKPRDYKKAFGCIAKHMRSMFLHAYQSYLWNKAVSYRIEEGGASEVMEGDLVLIENKTLGEGGNGTSGLKGKKVTVVTQDDVEIGKYRITDVVLPLIGTRTELPTNGTGDMLETLLEEDGLTLESFQGIQDRELALGGDYRKMICKPTDVDFEIKLYKDPLQPLIKTDLMTIQGEELECVDVTQDLDNNNQKDGEKVLAAMVIGFTLPPSAYATIALRELMKRPTSAEYQMTLKLEGACEGPIESDETTKIE